MCSCVAKAVFMLSIKKTLIANSVKKGLHEKNKNLKDYKERMAKRSSIEKQKRRERTVNLKRAKREELHAKARDFSLTEEERQAARTALNKMPRDSSPVRLRNRCVLTGRCRGYMRKFKLSRLCFRELASFGMIPGITKSSW